MTILPIVLVIAAVAAYLLSRAALRPVDRIRAAAQTLTTTPHPDTDAPLPVPPTDDEIAWLATTLNTMLTRLQRASPTNNSSSPTPATNYAPRWHC